MKYAIYVGLAVAGLLGFWLLSVLPTFLDMGTLAVAMVLSYFAGGLNQKYKENKINLGV
jgi:hypothetical protein